ncbi:Venom acid phosphatase Acph-1 [Anthophora retusa]
MFPKAPHNPIYDMVGLGQLTEVGKMREYHLGKLLREMYGKFLENTHRYGDVYGTSTDFQRTKMSLQLVLQGLYSGIASSPNETNWPTMSTKSPVPLIVDSTLVPIICPAYQEELRRVKSTAMFRLLISKYKDLFKYLEANTGYNMSSNPTLLTSSIYQYLTTQKSLNIPFPSWATESVQKGIESVAQLDYTVQSYTPKLKRLFGGMLVKKFIENMNPKENTATPKIYLYSAHEINIASFSKVHGFNEPKIPLYGSAIIVEKLRDIIGTQYIRIYLWTGVTENLITYTIPGCTTLCPYDRYIKLMKYVIPTDEESECLWNKITKDQLRLYYSIDLALIDLNKYMF